LKAYCLCFFGVGADQRDGLVAQVAGGPHRAELRVHEVGAAARVRDLADVDQRGELAFLGVDGGDLVALVGRHHEVALGAVPAAVVQEGAEPISVTFSASMLE
jgi:hypothetical protein